MSTNSRDNASRGWTRGGGRSRGGLGRGSRGWRGSSFGGGSRKHSTWHPPLRNVPTPRTDPLGAIIDSVNIKSLLVDEEAPKIKDAEYLASYNWVSGDAPTILVPGSPPAWTPPTTDTKLQEDDHTAFVDLNAARWPSYPLEPAVRSIEAMQPDFDLKAVDLLACSYTLGKILDIVLSGGEEFRFDVDVIGNTAFFTRKGASSTEIIKDLRGYGFRFPQVYTTWDLDVRDSVSHQRTIYYSFEGVNILLRSGVSGYLPKSTSALAPTSHNESVPISFEDALESLSLDSSVPSSQSLPLKLEKRGSLIPQKDTFDLKTRGVNNTLDTETMLPRLWLSQLPNFLLAYHKQGTFKKPEVQNFRADILKWEADNASALATFHALIKRILDTVRDADSGQCEVSWSGKGDLLITEQIGDGRRALPIDLHELFMG